MSKTITQDVKIRFNADTNAAKSQIQGLYDTLNKISNINPLNTNMTGSVSQLQEASRAAAELAIHLRNSTNVNTGKLNLKTFTNSLVKSGRTLSDFRTRLVAIGPEGTRAFQQLTQSIMVAEKPLFNMNSALKNLGTTLINSVKWQISSSVIHGLMGAAQKATGHVKALNESLNNIRIVSGQSAEAMDKFAQKANKLAKELNTTTTAYSDAALIFYQQGLDDSAVEERVNTVIKMANVTGEAAEDVSSYMTAVWNNFDDGTKSLEYYADGMTALGAATASSTAEIAAGLEKFAAIADTVGLSYEYATSALATVVAETRQSADVVGTAFKTIFSRLESLQLGENLDDGTTLNKYSAALASVGVNIKDQQGQLKDMDQILDELGNKWQNLSRDQQVALAQTVAGTRQYTQLISLMENYDTFKENVNIASGSDGTLQNQANIYAESWEAARKRVQASAEAIYEALLDDDFFIRLNNGLSSFLDSINLLIDGMGGLKGILPVISSLLFSMFGTQIAGYVDTLSLKVQSLGSKLFGLQDPYEKMRQQAGQMYANSIDTSAPTLSDSALNIGQDARLEVVERIKNIQGELIQQKEKLTGIDRQLYEQELNRLNTLNEETIQTGKTTTELERQLDSTKKLIEKSITKGKGLFADGNAATRIFGGNNDSNVKIIRDAAQAVGVTEEIGLTQTGKGRNKGYRLNVAGLDENQSLAIKNKLLDDTITKLTEAAQAQSYFNEEIMEQNELSNNLQHLDTFTTGNGGLAQLDSEDVGQYMASENFDKDVQTFTNVSSSIEQMTNKVNAYEQAMAKAGRLKLYNKGDENVLTNLSKAMSTLSKNSKEVESAYRKLNEAQKKLKIAQENKDTKAQAQAQEEVNKALEKVNTAKAKLATNTKAAEAAEKAFKETLAGMKNEGEAAAKALESLGYKFDPSALEEKARKLGISMSELVTKIKAGEIATEDLIAAGNRPMTFGQKMTQMASSLSQVAMGINAIKSIGNIWSDEDATVGEKILSTMMALPMVLSGVSAMTNLVTKSKEKGILATIKSIAAEKIDQAQKKKGTALTWLEVTAIYAKAAAKAVLNAIEEHGVVVGLAIAAAAVTAIGIMAASTKGIGAQTQALIEKSKAEEEAANKAEESANRVREAYDKLKQSFDAYTEARNKVDELTTGTEEWAKAIEDANKKARELLIAYPELVAKMNKNGVLEISEDSIDDVSNYLEKQADQLERFSQTMSLRSKQTSEEAKYSELFDSIEGKSAFSSSGEDTAYYNNKYIKKYRDLGNDGWDLDREQIIKDAVEIFKENPAISAEDLAIEIGIPEDLAEELVKNNEALVKNFEATDNLTRVSGLIYKELAREFLVGNEEYEKSQNKEASARFAGEVYKKAYEDKMKTADRDGEDAYDFAYNWGPFGDNLDDDFKDRIIKYIASQYGVSEDEVSGIEWGDTEDEFQRVSFSINGQQYDDIKVTSTDLANYEANLAGEEAALAAVETINGYLGSSTGKTALEIYGNMSAGTLTGAELADFFSNKDNTFEGLRDAYREAGFDETQVQQMQEEVERNAELSRQAREDIFNSTTSSAQNILGRYSSTDGYYGLDFSEDAFKQVAENVNRIGIQFGSDMAEQYANALGETGITDPEFINQLAQIDVTAEGSEESIRALGKEFNLSDSTINNLINTFDDFQIAAAKTGEVISQTISSILKDIDKLKMGSTIAPEKYEEYKNILGDQIDSYFVKMADGTYMLTAEADSFQQMLKTGTAEWGLETRNNMDNVLNKYSRNLLSDDYLDELEGRKDKDDVMGEESSAIQLMKAAGIDLENSLDIDKDGNFIINDKFIETMKQVRDIYNSADASVAGLSDSVVVLDKRLAEGKINSEDYDANMRRLATSYEDARDELNEYNKAIKLYGKDSKEAKDAQLALNKAVRQAQIDEAAVQILNASDKLKELTQGTEDYIKELENQAKAFNEAFGTNVDSTFVEQYQDLINIWASGGENSEDIGSYLYILAEANNTAWSQIIEDTQNASDIISAIINGTSGTIVVNGEADLTQLINSLIAAGATGEEVAKILNELGYSEIKFEGDFKAGPMPSFDNPEEWANWFNSIEGNIKAVSAKVPANLPKPNMQNVANKRNKSDSSGGGGSEKKKVEDETERYHESDREIARLERETSRLEEAKDLAFGASKVELIDSETQALENEIEALEKLNSEIETYYAQDKANIAQFGATFDEYGNINNYDEIIANAVEQYNSGAWTEEKYEAFKKYLEQYEETLDKWYDNQDAITDKQRDILEKKMEKIELQVQLEIDLSEDSLEYLEYQLSKIEDEAFAAADAIALINEEVGTTLQKSATYQKGLTDLEALAAENMANGIAVGSGGWTEDMISQAREYRSSLLEVNQELEEYRKTIEEKLTVAIDEMNEKLDEQIARFDTYGSILDHYTTILGLSGKSLKNSSLIIELGNKTVENAINKLESAKAKQDALESSLENAQKEYNDALARGDTETIKYWEDQIEKLTIQVEEGKETILATFEETLQTAADVFAAAVEQTVATLSSALSKYESLNTAADQFEKQKTLAEQFLDTNTQIYELSKLMRTINGEIAKTDNLAAKSKLRDVMEEINDIQANNTKLTKYDLDILNAKYQLRLAEIALEESQNAKNQVRLTQTAGGGWGYVYTANQESIDKAQQNYEDKLYAMQQLSQDSINELSDSIIQNEQEMIEALGNLRAEDFEDYAAYEAELNRLTEYYLERDKFLREQFGKAIEDAGINYEDTLLYKVEPAAQNWEQAHQNVVNNVNGAVQSMTDHYDEWKDKVSDAYKAAGYDEGKFRDQVIEHSGDIIKASEKTAEKLKDEAKAYSDYLTEVISAIGAFQTKYSTTMGQVITENEKIVQSMNDIFKKFTNMANAAEETAKRIINAASQTAQANWGSPGGSGNYNGFVPGPNPGPDNPTTYKYTYNVNKNSKIIDSGGKRYLDIGNDTFVLLSDITEKATFIRGNSYGWIYGTNTELQKYRWYSMSQWRGLVPFDTGGYTGAWGSEGRMAMLHEKEIVLNKTDTKNLLTSIEVVRSIASQLDMIGRYQRMSELISAYGVINGGKENFEQNVHISAEFPNVVDHNEIEEAINNLINYSSQYMNRYR